MPPNRQQTNSRPLTPSQLQGLRDDSIKTLQDMEAAIVRTRNQLKYMETLMRRVRKMLEAGRGASEVARTANAAHARAATSDIIREVQSARHRAQRAQFKLAAAEGSSMAEIARAWGVSRQLVSRMVKEASSHRRS